MSKSKMTQSDAIRIQSASDKNPKSTSATSGFKGRAQSAASKSQSQSSSNSSKSNSSNKGSSNKSGGSKGGSKSSKK